MRIKLFLLSALLLLSADRVFCQETNIFTVYGTVYQPDGMQPIGDGFRVTVINRTQGDTLTAVTGENGSGAYNVVFIDFNDNVAAAAGDSLRFLVYTPSGIPRSNSIDVEISSVYITTRRMHRNLTAPAVGVQLFAPPEELCFPGQQCTTTFTIQNSGEIEDLYYIDLTVEHPEWLVACPESIGPLAPGQSAIADVVLSIPDTLSWAIHEQITLTACSRLDPGECASAGTFRAIPTLVQNSTVAFEGDHVEISWLFAPEALGSQFALVRCVQPGGQCLELNRDHIEQYNETFIYRDYEVAAGVTYEYLLRMEGEETRLYPLGTVSVPRRSVQLYQNYPNPFRPVTTIGFDLPEEARVTLRIYDVNGRLVRTLIEAEPLPANFYQYEWDGRTDAGQPAGSGIYLYRLSVNRRSMIKKMILLR